MSENARFIHGGKSIVIIFFVTKWLRIRPFFKTLEENFWKKVDGFASIEMLSEIRDGVESVESKKKHIVKSS